MGRKITHEEVKEYIKSFGYEFYGFEIGKTKGGKEEKYVRVKCDKEHDSYLVRFSAFKKGARCPYCNGGVKYSYEYVKKCIEKEGYKLLSTEYENSNQKLSVKCPKGHTWDVRFRAFNYEKHRCPYCYEKNIKFDYKNVKKYIEQFNYELLSKEYKNNKTPLEIKCPLGHVFLMNLDSFKNKESRCPYCSKKHHYTYQEVKGYIESFGYKLLSEEYTDCKKYLKISCPEGHEYFSTFDNFKNKERRCSVCNISKGERKIMNWLDKNNINYIYDQPYFENLFGNTTLLRPDFIIENKRIWIEYDGEFHYRDSYKDGAYEKTILYDELKNKYAEENGWKLIRIPYWDFDNIEEILEKELLQNGSQ